MSFFKHRPNRKHIRALLSGSKPESASSSTTDDIPVSLNAYDTIRTLPRRPSDTLSGAKRPRSSPTLRSVISASTPTPSNANMAGRASITFTQPGVQAPVYVVTSLSNPPWVPLELSVSDEKTPSGDLIFTRAFDNVAEGSYQYKIRIGEGHWVVDESKDSITDASGNRNNVINVAPDVNSPLVATSAAASIKDRQDSVQATDPRAEDTSSHYQPSYPTPFVVVDKVASKDRPEYGNIKPGSLHEDAAKRTADAEPDFESTLPGTPASAQLKDSGAPPVPTVVVEKIDDSLAHGDDFGKEATSAQKLAHELRAADASPDKVIVSAESETADGASTHVDVPDTEATDAETAEQTAPLFGHETVASEFKPQVEQGAPLFLHEAVQPTSEGRTTADPVPSLTTPEPLPQEQDAPLFRHETFLPETGSVGAIEEESAQSSTDQDSSYAGLNTPSDDSDDLGEQDGVIIGTPGELDNGPLLPHEMGFADDDEESLDELDNGPLLSHETGFSGVENEASLLDYDEEEHDDDYDAEYEDEYPLLPHERNSSLSNSEGGGSAFPGAKEAFLSRTDSSSLPHRIPPSDEEDDDLHDPSLEEFPTERELIFERVATIESQLPADETRDLLHSPELTVMSQVCSSDDLAPSTSHTSLRPVAEEDILESESERADEPRLSDAQPPILIDSDQIGRADFHKAPEPTQASDAISHSHSVSEAESVQKIDGAKDTPKDPSKIYDAIATPAKILNPPTPPLTPEKATNPPHTSDNSSTPKGSQDTEVSPLKPRTDLSQTQATSPNPEPKKDSPLHAFIRFLISCFGGPKQASGAALVVGTAALAYFYLYGF